MSSLMHDRMPPIPKDQWTHAQKRAADEFAKARGQECDQTIHVNFLVQKKL